MNAVFIHIPKTGGRSIEKALDLQEYRSWRWIGRNPSLITFGHASLSYEIGKGRFYPKGWFIFTFVRNPFDRFVSLYSFMTKQGQSKDKFKDFCRILNRVPAGIFSNQSKWLKDVNVDFIGKFENLANDFDRLCSILEVEPKHLPHINSSEHLPWQEYYDDETLEIVHKYYQEDFEKFGYT